MPNAVTITSTCIITPTHSANRILSIGAQQFVLTFGSIIFLVLFVGGH